MYLLAPISPSAKSTEDIIPITTHAHTPEATHNVVGAPQVGEHGSSRWSGSAGRSNPIGLRPERGVVGELGGEGGEGGGPCPLARGSVRDTGDSSRGAAGLPYLRLRSPLDREWSGEGPQHTIIGSEVLFRALVLDLNRSTH